MKKTIIGFALLTLIAGVNAEARGRFGGDGYGGHRRGIGKCPTGHNGLEIDMYDQVFRGRRGVPNVIPLKKKLKQRYRYLNLQNMKLDGVCLMAKSKAGRGEAALVVGQREKDRSGVDGNRRDYRDSRRYTYDEVQLNNYGRSQGAWQVELRGNIKVKKVVVYASEKRRGKRRRGRMQYTKVGEKRFDKVIYTTKTYSVNLSKVQNISLTAKGSDIHVDSVLVTFGNGRTKELYNLSGYLDEGGIVSASIQGRNVTRVKVTATSPQIFNGRGKLQVEVGHK